MYVDGHCYCGRIAFVADADPATVVVCHCTDCQELTGSAYRAVVTARNLVIRSGTPKVWLKQADSGRTRAHAFCPDCGSPIYSGPPDGSLETCSLRIGTLTQRSELPPARQIWCRSALPWALDLTAIEPHEKQ
jgi:hypothetical protein